MRGHLFLMGFCLAVSSSSQVLINEVKPGRDPGTDGKGPNGDWVELYNAGNHSVDLGGHILALGMRAHYLPQGLNAGPGQHLVLWCGQKDGLGIPMGLPAKGGALLLVAPDGAQVLDVFRWPSLPPGSSMGRKRDGGKEWGFCTQPTPGGANKVDASRLLPTPGIQYADGLLELVGPPDAEIRYTIDGSTPDAGGLLYRAPVRVAPGTVVRARAFAPEALPGPMVVRTLNVDDKTWALVVAPEDLWGSNGLVDTLRANHVRRGRSWQRQAWIQRGGQVLPVGVAISGSGSRGLPKRNLKLMVRDRFQGDQRIGLPDGSLWKNVLLRADATPNAFLRNLFMEEVARRSGNRVDVQPSRPVDLLLNGEPQGLYRAMPTKGAEWIRSLNGDGPVEIVEGTAATAVKGDAKHFRRALQALQDARPVDSLERQMDVQSLVELACYDLWTGRVDHELNVRAWRPRAKDGRWRWVMYDMDLWATAEDRTVHRMCGTQVPETPFLPQLLAQSGLRDLLLARLSALCATTLNPGRAIALLDSLYDRHRDAMERDQARWAKEMTVPAPEGSRNVLVRHIARRPDHLLPEMAQYTGRPLHTVTVQVEPAGAGQVEVEHLFLTAGRQDLKVFDDVPLHLHAKAAYGMEFVGWKGAGPDPDLTLRPRGNTRVTAIFRPVAWSSQGGL
ncbi:MAG TPA: CotH kinase family protein [Flavobacteriales bacterium]|nr:CotH kinase family protein [Flavobacteriales bacterium]